MGKMRKPCSGMDEETLVREDEETLVRGDVQDTLDVDWIKKPRFGEKMKKP